MSAQPAEPATTQPSNVIQLGGETAVVVPMDAYRRMQALMHLAPAELLDEAEMAVETGADRQWSASGGAPGLSGVDVRRRLGLGGS
jgi:hypothetical protein